MTPDEYMQVLLDRQTEYMAGSLPMLGFPPLLDWFIRDGDEDLVDMAAIDRINAATYDCPRPVKHVTAETIKGRLLRNRASLTVQEQQLQALTAGARADNATINIPFHKRSGNIDAQVVKAVRLAGRIAELDHKIRLDVARLRRLKEEA